MKFRLILIFLFLFVMYVGLSVRLFKIQIIGYEKFSKIAESSYFIRIDKVSPRRGEILDRNGRVLALNKHTYSVGFNYRHGKITDSMVRDLSKLLKMDLSVVRKKLRDAQGFIWLRRHIDPQAARGLFKYQKDGLSVIKENHRFYPQDPLASNVVGSVGMDNQGLSGIEYNFDDQLKITTSKQKMRDARGRIVYLLDMYREKANRTVKIYLTIDSNLQHIAERELIKGVKKFKPQRAMAIIQNPSNGELLAVASYPSFSSNSRELVKTENLKNKMVSNIFEPGSIFKIVTAAAALEEQVVEIDEKIDCEGGVFEVGGFPIRDFKPYDELSFKDCMVYSSNIGLAKIGERLGKKMLYKYARDFGFGNFTGVRLPGETRGILRRPSRWSGTSLSRISFGQEVGVTAVQLVAALSTIANGGVLYEPKIISRIEEDGKARHFEPLRVRRVISSDTSANLTAILKEAVARGTGVQAAVEGYTVAGKSGTAQKFDIETLSYAKGRYVAVFGGYVPADDPRLTILVIFDEPDKSLYWGGYVAAPVFSSIADASLNYMNIPPDKNRIPAMPDKLQ